MTKTKTMSRVLTLALAIVMACSLFAVTAFASGPLDPDFTQDNYLYWFGDPNVPSTNYPSFQPAPMGDDAIIGYDRDGDEVEFYFQNITVDNYRGYIDGIYVDYSATNSYEPNDPQDPLAGGYAIFESPEVDPDGYNGNLIHVTTLTIALLDAPFDHIELHNVWLAVDN
jgi:hypothetical protein